MTTSFPQKTLRWLLGAIFVLSPLGCSSESDNLPVVPDTVLDNSVVETEDEVVTTEGEDVPVAPKTIDLTSFQTAAVVIGQQDMTSAESCSIDSYTTSASRLCPEGNPAITSDGRLVVADMGNHRVLVFNQIPDVDGADADFVLGQTDFTSRTVANVHSDYVPPNKFLFPRAVAVDDQDRLFVLDPGRAAMSFHNRILIWNSFPTSSMQNANVVVGQPNFVSKNFGCGPATFYDPEGFFVVNEKLLVADTDNNRVLIWNEIPTSHGEPADLVLGQTDFDQCNGPGPTDLNAVRMNNPVSVWSDGTRIVVADKGHTRILIWNEFPTENGEPADLVLIQPDLEMDSIWTSNYYDPSVVIAPLRSGAVTSNGTQLFSVQEEGHRIAIWSEFPTENGVNPDLVLGQSDLDFEMYGAPNDDDQNNVEDAAPSGRTLKLETYSASGSGIALSDDTLVVPDERNRRLLVYRANK